MLLPEERIFWRRRGLNPGPFRNFAKCKRNALPLRHIPFDISFFKSSVYIKLTASRPHGLVRTVMFVHLGYHALLPAGFRQGSHQAGMYRMHRTFACSASCRNRETGLAREIWKCSDKFCNILAGKCSLSLRFPRH